MSEDFGVEKARRIWNCEHFHRPSGECRATFIIVRCALFYVGDCQFFEERFDKEEPPKKLVEYINVLRKEHENKKSIRRNVEIAKSLIRFRDQKSRKRLMFAIYRLYRYSGLSPNEISSAIGIPVSRVQFMIGKAFQGQCLKDDSRY